MKLKLATVRLAFPDIWEARSFNGEGDPAFSATFLIDSEDKKQIEIIESAITDVAKEKWKGKAESVLKQLKAQERTALRDGDLKSEYDGFEGNMYLAARSHVRPLIIDRDKSTLIKSDGKPYGGCYVNAVVDIWAQDNQFGKRINATLQGIQFVKDGQAFSGSSTASESDFDEIDSDDDFDDL